MADPIEAGELADPDLCTLEYAYRKRLKPIAKHEDMLMPLWECRMWKLLGPHFNGIGGLLGYFEFTINMAVGRRSGKTKSRDVA